ncbi:MAG: SAM-dependent methyltransferase [Microbacteriaceae bacterium]|nr:MAG: SAM-dependent methyltransferase [Microbacteriaceae bacterium]
MSEIIDINDEWLALREPEDARARSHELTRAAASMLPTGPIVVHDLGSGTGSMMRWLAPRLPGPQAWVLHDWNPRLTEQAAGGPRPLDHEGTPVTVSVRIAELDDLAPADLRGASLVTASALLDVLTSRETHSIVEACLAAGCPVLVTLSVTGSVELRPGDERDTTLMNAFNAHQRRITDGRQPLGQCAPSVVRGLFAQAGWQVRSSATRWLLDSRRPRLLHEWLDGWVGAAVEQSPELADEATRYRELRASQQEHGQLSAVVHHVDLLACPR